MRSYSPDSNLATMLVRAGMSAKPRDRKAMAYPRQVSNVKAGERSVPLH